MNETGNDTPRPVSPRQEFVIQQIRRVLNEELGLKDAYPNKPRVQEGIDSLAYRLWETIRKAQNHQEAKSEPDQ